MQANSLIRSKEKHPTCVAYDEMRFHERKQSVLSYPPELCCKQFILTANCICLNKISETYSLTEIHRLLALGTLWSHGVLMMKNVETRVQSVSYSAWSTVSSGFLCRSSSLNAPGASFLSMHRAYLGLRNPAPSRRASDDSSAPTPCLSPFSLLLVRYAQIHTT